MDYARNHNLWLLYILLNGIVYLLREPWSLQSVIRNMLSNLVLGHLILVHLFFHFADSLVRIDDLLKRLSNNRALEVVAWSLGSFVLVHEALVH